MGIFKKYRDENGKPKGPWYIQYPERRDAETGKVKYRTKKASWKKRKAQEMLRKKQEEFTEREQLGTKLQPDLAFSELVDWALDQQVMKAKASASGDKEKGKILKDYFGAYKAVQITPLMVENFRIKMKSTVSKTGRPFSGTTINKIVSLGRRVFYLAMEDGRVESNPFARRGVFKEHPKGLFIPDEDFWKIHECLPDFMKPVVVTAYLTGMRRGEIFNLRWSSVDLENGIIDLSPEETKTDEPRLVSINAFPELRKAFLEAELKRKPGQKLVFVKNDGKAIPPHYSYRWFKRACKKAGLRHYRFHDLRHSFNTNMDEAGVNRSVIMKMTGHKTMAMFLRYRHVNGKQSKEAMNRLSEYLEKEREQGSGRKASPALDSKETEETIYSLSTP